MKKQEKKVVVENIMVKYFKILLMHLNEFM